MVTVIGSVPAASEDTDDPSEPRRFTIETSVYDASKASPVTFSVACFLENTKRWQKVKTPSTGALLSITAKVAGRTTDTNRLALRVLDLALPPEVDLRPHGHANADIYSVFKAIRALRGSGHSVHPF